MSGVDADHAAAIAERFDLGAGAKLTGPVARGEQGQVWRLDTARGAWAVKEPFAWQSEDDHRAHADFQDAVWDAGVAVPQIVRTTEGEIFAEVDTSQIRVYGWIDLDPPDPGIDPAAVGRVVAAIHCVPFDGPHPVDPWYTEVVGAEQWDDLLGQLAASGAPFATDLAALLDDVVATEALMEPATELRTCHRDLFADNVVTGPDDAVFVIDWENSGLASPSQELAVVLFEFANGDPARGAALYHSYVDAGGPARIAAPGDFSMAIAQLGNITAMACARWLATADTGERARLAARVAEFTDRPLTRTTIDGLLSAATH